MTRALRSIVLFMLTWYLLVRIALWIFLVPWKARQRTAALDAIYELAKDNEEGVERVSHYVGVDTDAIWRLTKWFARKLGGLGSP